MCVYVCERSFLYLLIVITRSINKKDGQEKYKGRMEREREREEKADGFSQLTKT